MCDTTYIQRCEVIHKCEQLLHDELDNNPLFRKFPETLQPIWDEYHYYATMFSLSRYINKDLVCKLIDIINRYHVSSSATDTESKPR